MARNRARRGRPSGLSAAAGRTAGARRGTGIVLAAACLAGSVTACSPRATAATAGGSCGTTRTAANVPVEIKVVRGQVECPVALRVERAYASMIRHGDIRGNGGGAPVTVRGWTCQGFATPHVLRTGYASQCHTASAEVVAVLAAPSAAT